MKKPVDCEAINSKNNCVRYRNSLTFMSQKNRTKPTNAEKIMWDKILSRDKTGYRFLRQKPINRFIIDFYCPKLLLAIEIDGGSHIQKKGTDEMRDNFLKQVGITTIRFTNDEVVNDIENVKIKINEFIPRLVNP